MSKYVDDGYVSTRYVQEGVTVNWPTREIFVPKAELILLQTDPIEVYQMDIDWFRLQLKALEYDESEGMSWVDTHEHFPPITVGGVDLARVVSIINDYTITFEDGNYAVNLVNANSNIADRVNVNQVSVRSANSAGLPNLDALLSTTYAGEVFVNKDSVYSGTTYPVGTRRYPVNNVQDAVLIAEREGLGDIHFFNQYTLDTGDDVSGYTLSGNNAANCQLIVNEGAITNNCQIHDVYLTGTLDGGTIVERCVIDNLNYVNGFVYKCMLAPGIITLGGSATAYFLECYSGQPGTGTPTIDMNGTGNDDVPLAMRSYSGGIQLIEKTGSGAVSLDFISGQAKIATSCTNGQVVVRGVSKVYDENGNHLETGTINGGLTLVNEVVNGEHIHDIWNQMGLNPDGPGGVGALLTPQVIASLVWEETASVHTTLDTFGAAVNDIKNIVAGQTDGLTTAQNTMLMEIYRMYGLDPTRPLVVTNAARNAGPEISQTINCTDNITTITRS